MKEITMQGVNCGNKTLQKKDVERYEYVEGGLRGVYLKGATVHHCKTTKKTTTRNLTRTSTQAPGFIHGVSAFS